MVTEHPKSTEAPLCDACRRVPISHLSLDISEPLEGWMEFFRKRGTEIVDDHLGRPSVRRYILADLIDEERARARELAEQAAQKVAAQQPVVLARGVPAQEGSTPLESMQAGPGYTTVRQEFGHGGSVATELLEAELARGREHEAAKREAARRRKEKK